jgi:putative Mg2+ transporter-C (MgtC) family protein
MTVLNWGQLIDLLIKMGIVFALSFPVAWDRERSHSAIGLRTFPLLAMASCAYVILSLRVVGAGADTQARIIPGLMTGIGFVGGGVILRGTDHVHGTAMAVSIWGMGCVGAAVAYGYYDIAVVFSLLDYLVFRLLTPIRYKLREDQDRRGGLND